MKKILLILFLIQFFTLKSQVCTTAVIYDYIETYTWASGWNVGSNGGYYTNAFVSSNASAALIGSGNGSSPIESGYYILPNVTGLISTNTYYLEFRLGSYKFGGPTATTAGNDVGDYVDVQFSSNNSTYVSELRITGNNNATWDYSSTAVASKTANGLLTTIGPAGGGDRTLLGDGYSTVRLTLPAGTTQAAFRLYCRANSAGEEWWLDNIILWELGPCIPLPIELVSFEGFNESDYNKITWKTATESNNHYFTLERSLDGFTWESIHIEEGAGTVSTPNLYIYNDYSFEKNVINYYRLSQTDFNGNREYFNIIGIESKNKIKCEDYTYYNLSGIEVKYEEVPPGLYLRKCGDKIEKVVKIN